MASVGSNEEKAQLVPADGPRQEAMRRAIGDIRRLRKGIALGPGLSPRDLVEAGRRH